MSKLSVQFLGSGDAFGSGGRGHTCIYVHADEVRFLMDCGASAPIALKHFGVDSAQLHAILLTHLHGDHFGGLPFLLLDMHLLAKRTLPLVIAGPVSTTQKVREAMELFFPGSTQVRLSFPLTFVEFTPRQPQTLGALTVTAYPVIHSPGTNPHALRVTCAGKVIAYSGDTEWTDALIEVAADADLFICEAYFYEKSVKYHLSYRELMAHRAALPARRIILTHLSDDLLKRLPSLELECADDGQCIEV